MNMSKYEEYVVKWNEPVKKHFVKYWISIFKKDSMERICSTLINRNRSDCGYHFDKDVKEFLQKNLSHKLEADVLKKEELNLIAKISINEHDLLYNEGEISLELESDNSNLFIKVSEMEDNASYKNEVKSRNDKINNKSQPFIQMLKETYELSDEELDFLIPTHKNFVCNDLLRFRMLEESCMQYSDAR